MTIFYTRGFRNFYTFCLTVLLIFSNFVGSYDVFAEKNTVEKDHIQYAKTNSVTNVYAEDGEAELGQISANSIFPIIGQEGDQIFIQWDDHFAVIDKENVDILDDFNDNKVPYINYDEVETQGNLTILEEFEVSTENNDFTIKMFKGVQYSFISIDDQGYKLLIANRMLSVDKQWVETESEAREKKEFDSEEPINEDQGLEQEVAGEPAEQVTEQKNVNEVETDNKYVRQQNHLAEEMQVEQNGAIKNGDSSNTHLLMNDESSIFSADTKYFKVVSDNLKVYERTKNGRVEVGYLEKGEVYPRIGDFGKDWHRIQYGTGYGYVWKDGTTPADGNVIQNENNGQYKHSQREFTVLNNLPVYDNSSGDLVQFATLRKGTKYPIISNYGHWYRVEVAGRIGYIYKSGVKVDFQKGDGYFEVTRDHLTVYKQTNDGLIAVGSLEKGQIYPRISDYGNWHRIQYGKEYGYVWKKSTLPSDGSRIRNENKGEYNQSNRQAKALSDLQVYDNSSGKLVPFATLKKGINYPIVSDYGNWYRILVSGRVGYIYKDGVLPDFLPEDRYFEVLSDDLPVYKEGKSGVIGTLKKGQVYPRISGFGSNWHRIKFGSGYGYVYISGTRPANGNEIQNENAGKYQETNRTFEALRDLPVYDNSSGKLVPFATIKKGQKYRIISGYGPNWYRVDVSGRIGYVPTSGTKAEFRNDELYFEVLEEDLIIYQEGKSAILGTLRKGEVYPRISAYGESWHRIKFGNGYGYVYTQGTRPANGSILENENDGRYRNSNMTFMTVKDVTVYDNNNGLIPFAVLVKGIEYPIVSDYGNWWRIDVSGRIGYVQKSQLSEKIYKYTHYGYTLDEMVNIQMEKGSPKSDGAGTKPASRQEVKYYADPSNFKKETKEFLQFLVLSKPAGLNATEVNNKILYDKGILKGTAQAFIDAGNRYNINEAYLIAHTLHETGNGTSILASGVPVDKNGNVTRNSRGEIAETSNTKHIVYNMYGYGARDSCPIECGAKYAFNRGWFTPSAAIRGGAESVSTNYIQAGQDTLYKMKWNPDNPGTHQYATHVQWAVAQTNRIHEIYNLLNNYIMEFDVPKFLGQP